MITHAIPGAGLHAIFLHSITMFRYSHHTQRALHLTNCKRLTRIDIGRYNHDLQSTYVHTHVPMHACMHTPPTPRLVHVECPCLAQQYDQFNRTNPSLCKQVMPWQIQRLSPNPALTYNMHFLIHVHQRNS